MIKPLLISLIIFIFSRYIIQRSKRRRTVTLNRVMQSTRLSKMGIYVDDPINTVLDHFLDTRYKREDDLNAIRLMLKGELTL